MVRRSKSWFRRRHRRFPLAQLGHKRPRVLDGNAIKPTPASRCHRRGYRDARPSAAGIASIKAAWPLGDAWSGRQVSDCPQPSCRVRLPTFTRELNLAAPWNGLRAPQGQDRGHVPRAPTRSPDGLNSGGVSGSGNGAEPSHCAGHLRDHTLAKAALRARLSALGPPLCASRNSGSAMPAAASRATSLDP